MRSSELRFLSGRSLRMSYASSLPVWMASAYVRLQQEEATCAAVHAAHGESHAAFLRERSIVAEEMKQQDICMQETAAEVQRKEAHASDEAAEVVRRAANTADRERFVDQGRLQEVCALSARDAAVLRSEQTFYEQQILFAE